jgi:hypothetical protein
MSDLLERDILLAFPALPLGKAAKELRRLTETIGGAAGLDQVTVWTDLVQPLLAAETGDLPGQIMFLDADAWRALLPAWMVASLRSRVEHRTLNLLGSVLAVLDPGFTKAPDVFHERAMSLTATQRASISEFVHWATQQAILATDPQANAEIARLQAAWPIDQHSLSR